MRCCLAKSVLVLLVLVASPAVIALEQERLELPGTAIIGNQELPTALYIVPWKKPRPATTFNLPPDRLDKKDLLPIDRQVFRRQMYLFDRQLQLNESR